MKIQFHPAVEQDVAEALRWYQAVSLRLSQEFQAELRRVIAVAAAQPGRFHLIKPGLHRANLKRFPYHFLYRELPDGIRVTLVRHHRREPRFGLERARAGSFLGRSLTNSGALPLQPSGPVRIIGA